MDQVSGTLGPGRRAPDRGQDRGPPVSRKPVGSGHSPRSSGEFRVPHEITTSMPSPFTNPYRQRFARADDGGYGPGDSSPGSLDSPAISTSSGTVSLGESMSSQTPWAHSHGIIPTQTPSRRSVEAEVFAEPVGPGPTQRGQSPAISPVTAAKPTDWAWTKAASASSGPESGYQGRFRASGLAENSEEASERSHELSTSHQPLRVQQAHHGHHAGHYEEVASVTSKTNSISNSNVNSYVNSIENSVAGSAAGSYTGSFAGSMANSVSGSDGRLVSPEPDWDSPGVYLGNSRAEQMLRDAYAEYNQSTAPLNIVHGSTAHPAASDDEDIRVGTPASREASLDPSIEQSPRSLHGAHGQGRLASPFAQTSVVSLGLGHGEAVRSLETDRPTVAQPYGGLYTQESTSISRDRTIVAETSESDEETPRANSGVPYPLDDSLDMIPSANLGSTLSPHSSHSGPGPRYRASSETVATTGTGTGSEHKAYHVGMPAPPIPNTYGDLGISSPRDGLGHAESDLDFDLDADRGTQSRPTSLAHSSLKSQGRTSQAGSRAVSEAAPATAPAGPPSQEESLGIGMGSAYVKYLRSSIGDAYSRKLPAKLPIGVKSGKKKQYRVPQEFLRKAMDIRYTHLQPRMLASEIDDDDEPLGAPGTPKNPQVGPGGSGAGTAQIPSQGQTNQLAPTDSRRSSASVESVVADVGRLKLFVANPDDDSD